jgi:DNA transformation protein
MDASGITDLFSAFGPVSVRRMFGGVGIFRDGLMIGIGFDGEVFLKTDDQSKDRFAEAGSTPFVYAAKGKTVALGYWRLPAYLYDDPTELADWARQAEAVARRASDKKSGVRPVRTKSDRSPKTKQVRASKKTRTTARQ